MANPCSKNAIMENDSQWYTFECQICMINPSRWVQNLGEFQSKGTVSVKGLHSSYGGTDGPHRLLHNSALKRINEFKGEIPIVRIRIPSGEDEKKKKSN